MEQQSGYTIELYFSDAVEQLAEQLSDALAASQSAGDLFEAQQVIVPNGNMAKYLQLAIARHNGVCANIDFTPFERGLWNATARIKGSRINGNEAHILNQKGLSQLILVALTRWKDRPSFAPFTEYLDENCGGRASSRRKLWQLSVRLATRFLEYQLHRPDMIGEWFKGGLYFANKEESVRQLELAQRELYLSIFDSLMHDGLRDELCSGHLTLFEFAQGIEATFFRGEPRDMYIFTPSRLSGFHRRLFTLLSRYYRIHVYHLNVCSEFWEDIQTTGEQRWLHQFQNIPVHENPESPDCFELEEDSDLENPLLKAWGKPGREALKVYSDLERDAAYFNIHFENSWLAGSRTITATHSLLATLQSDILLRRTSPAQEYTPAEQQSLQICQAPSIRREVESVYHSIVRNVEQNPHLELSDIVVLVPDMSIYRTAFESVFERRNQSGERRIAYSLVDSRCTTESIYARGVESLFTLLEDDFVRRDLFELLRNPCVQAACDCTNDNVERWLQLCESAGIYRGYHTNYHHAQDVTVARMFTWEEGLRRLRLGTITAVDASLQGSIPSPGASSDDVGHLTLIIERLFYYKKRFEMINAPSQWGELIQNFFNEFLVVPEKMRQEQAVQRSVTTALESLTILEQAQAELSIEDIRIYLHDEMDALHAGRGSYLSGGVVIASLQPMRPIPFKVTYVLGLDEKTFPGTLSNDAMDLRMRNRRIGDINIVESMSYLFLETLVCTREKLYLSYVAENIKKDEEILPSPVIREIRAYLRIVCPEFSLCKLSLESSAEENLRPDPTVSYDFQTLYGVTENGGGPWKHAALAAGVEKFPAHEHAPGVHGEVKQVSIRELSFFLRNPIVATLGYFGALISQDEDASRIADEPFNLGGLDTWKLYTQGVLSYLNDTAYNTLDEALSAEYVKSLQRWEVPVPLFANIEGLSSHADGGDAIKSGVHTYLSGSVLDGPLVVGDSEVRRTPSLELPGLLLTLASGQCIEVIGSLDQVWMTPDTRLCGSVVVTSKDTFPTYHQLQPYLMWCLLKALEPSCAQFALTDPFTIVTISKKGIHPLMCGTTLTGDENECMWDAASAQHYLAVLIQEYLRFSLDYLPFELGMKLNLTDTSYDQYKAGAEECLEKERFADFLRVLELSYPSQACELYQKRLGPFLGFITSSRPTKSRGRRS